MDEYLRIDYLEKRLEHYKNMIALRDRIQDEFKWDLLGRDKIGKAIRNHIIYHLHKKMNIKLVIIANIIGTSVASTYMIAKNMTNDSSRRIKKMEEEIEERIQGHLPKHRRPYEFRRKY